MCKLNTDTRNKINEKDATARDASGESGTNLRTATALLKKWIQASTMTLSNHQCCTNVDNQVHKPVLQHSAINALTLQRTPESCQTKLLYVRVSPNFSSDDQVGEVEIPRCFLLQDAFVGSIADARESLKSTLPDVDRVFAGVAEQSEAIRKQHGVGIVIVAVHVMPLEVIQLVPFGIPESLETLHVDREWKSRLVSMIAAGRVI